MTYKKKTINDCTTYVFFFVKSSMRKIYLKEKIVHQKIGDINKKLSTKKRKEVKVSKINLYCLCIYLYVKIQDIWNGHGALAPSRWFEGPGNAISGRGRYFQEALGHICFFKQWYLDNRKVDPKSRNVMNHMLGK